MNKEGEVIQKYKKVLVIKMYKMKQERKEERKDGKMKT